MRFNERDSHKALCTLECAQRTENIWKQYPYINTPKQNVRRLDDCMQTSATYTMTKPMEVMHQSTPYLSIQVHLSTKAITSWFKSENFGISASFTLSYTISVPFSSLGSFFELAKDMVPVRSTKVFSY